MIKKAKLFSAIFITVVVTGMLAGAALAAASVSIFNYNIDFVEAIKPPGSDTSKWVYAVTATPFSLSAVSHWTLDFGNCGYAVTQPADGSIYTTPVSYVPESGPYAGIDICGPSGPYDCQAAGYDTEYGKDDTTGLNGIKFQDPDIQLAPSNPFTHIFVIYLQKSGTHVKDDSAVAVKIGVGAGNKAIAYITGPACTPTAINLVELKASSGSGQTRSTLFGLSFTSILVGTLAYIKGYRKQLFD